MWCIIYQRPERYTPFDQTKTKSPQPTKKHYFYVKVILKYYSGEYSKLGHYNIFFNMDYGSSQHIKLIFKQKYFDTNMNKFFFNIIRKMLK